MQQAAAAATQAGLHSSYYTSTSSSSQALVLHTAMSMIHAQSCTTGTQTIIAMPVLACITCSTGAPGAVQGVLSAGLHSAEELQKWACLEGGHCAA